MVKHPLSIFPACLGLLLFINTATASGDSPRVSFRSSQTGLAVHTTIREWRIDTKLMDRTRRQALKAGSAPESVLPSLRFSSSRIWQAHNGTLPWQPAVQWRLWQVTAPEYAPLNVLLEPDTTVPLQTIWLDPVAQLTTKNTQPLCRPGSICGHVTIQGSHRPLANADITVQAGDIRLETLTAADGFFHIDLLEHSSITGKEKNLPAWLEVQTPGFISQRWTDIDWVSGAQLIIDLAHGSGKQSYSLKHPLADVPQGHIPLDWLKAKLGQLPSRAFSQPFITSETRWRKTGPAPNERPDGAIFMDPPDSITVGFAADGGYCCGNNCAISQVFSLESYVQKGLDNEWISSWSEDSLKAGSIPFRSYGAWHAMESPYAGYDICAGPCCQAFEHTSYASTVSAATATRGILLEIGGTLARSEYSAENNAWNDPTDGLSCTNDDLSCGDGFVGSPANGWPCLNDNSAGRGCFGHGRGMSQWGSHYHAQDGSNWARIVDHYYNALGNPVGWRSQYATTPVQLLSFAAWPVTLNAGAVFDISMYINNAAGNL